MVRVTRCCPHPSNLACADSERDPLMSTDNVLGPSCWGVNVTARSHDSPGARARPLQVPPTAKLSRSPDESMEIGEDAAPPTFETVMILIANIPSSMPEKEDGPATESRAPPLAAPESATVATAASEATRSSPENCPSWDGRKATCTSQVAAGARTIARHPSEVTMNAPASRPSRLVTSAAVGVPPSFEIRTEASADVSLGETVANWTLLRSKASAAGLAGSGLTDEDPQATQSARIPNDHRSMGPLPRELRREHGGGSRLRQPTNRKTEAAGAIAAKDRGA